MVATVAYAPAKRFRPSLRLIGDCPDGHCPSPPPCEAGNLIVAAAILRQAAEELAASGELARPCTNRLHVLAGRLTDRAGLTNQDALAASPIALSRTGVHVALVELIAAAQTVVDVSQPPSRRRAALIDQAKRLLQGLHWRFPEEASG